MVKKLSLYVHIPFCVKKCLYCDFLSFAASKELISDYFEALRREIVFSAKDYCEFEVNSIFFGGGTPSFVPEKEICDTLLCIKEGFNVSDSAEISIEANPASAMKDKLSAYFLSGFNRLSIGAQSLNDDELKRLGRAHTSEMFFETYQNARKIGFDNINIDIMSALPSQSLKSYLDTVKGVIELKPEHISAYSLIVEEGTPFYDMELVLPSEEVDREMYHDTKALLAENGYHRYEISNYAVNLDKECYHNKVYWKRGNYLGLGLGASSMVENTRWSNISDVGKYIATFNEPDFPADICHENIEKLSLNEQIEEYMFLGLRLVRGVSLEEFYRTFGKNIDEIYHDTIEKYFDLGLLAEKVDGNKHFLHLTDKGLDVSNTVMADFLLS